MAEELQLAKSEGSIADPELCRTEANLVPRLILLRQWNEPGYEVGRRLGNGSQQIRK